MKAAQHTVDQFEAIYAEAFGPRSTRTPRSEAYKLGAREALHSRLIDYRGLHCAHAAGTPEFDAYWAGVQEGNRLANDALANTTGSPK